VGQAPASFRAGRAAVIAVVACTVLVVALAALAASIGPDQVIRGEGPDRIEVTEPPTPTTSATVEDLDPLSEELPPADGDTPAWLRVIQVAVVAALFALALFGCAKLLRQLRAPKLRRRPAPGDEIDFEVVPGPSLVALAISADAEAQYQALLSGTPRDAIIECWQRFEERVAAAGVRRERWETSSELTQRVLTSVGADPGAVAGLAEAFREARFSRHEVGEDERDRAVELLREIQAGLRRTGAST
jgi:hypothetical protein